MRIGLISGEYPPDVGGIGDHTARLAGELAARGHTVQVVTSSTLQPPEGDRTDWPGSTDGTPGVSVLRTIPHWDWRLLATLPRLARRGAWDVLHIQYQPGAFELRGAINLVPGWLRLRWPGRRAMAPASVTTFHDLRVPYLFPKAGPLRPLAVRHLARTCDGIMAAAGDDVQQLRAWTTTLRPPPGLQQVPLGNALDAPPPPGFDRITWRARLRLPPEASLAGHFGLINRSKGLDVLVQALARLVAAGVDLHLLLIGDALGTADPTNAATLAGLRQAVATLGLQARVHWTGHCPPADVAGWLRCLDVAVLPFADGASLRRTSILASWANDVPVLTTTPANAVGWPTDPAPALTVPPGDVTALATALHQLLQDPRRRDALVRAGASVARRYSWSAVTAQTLLVYQEAIAHAGRTPVPG